MVRQLPLILVFVALVLYWLEGHLKDALYSTNLELARRSGYLAVAAVQTSMEGEGAHKTWERIGSMFSPIEGSRIQVVNVEGEVLYATDPDERSQVHRLTDASCSPCHAGGSIRAERQTTFIRGAEDEPSQVFAAPLRNTPDCRRCHEADGPKLGMVYVRQSLAPVNRLIRTTQIGLVIAGAVLLMLTVATWRVLFWRYIGRPLKRLVKHARAIGSGDLDSRVDLPDRTELAVLGDTLNGSAERLRRTIRQVESQRDDLQTLYDISEQLSKTVHPDERCRRAVELASSIFGSECVLVAGHFHPESRAFHGTVTYRGKNMEVVERSYPDEAVESAAPYYDPDLVQRWIEGGLDGETRVREGSTVAIPLEQGGRRLGLVLAPARRPEDSVDGRATAANPEVVQALRKHLTIALEFSELQRERMQRERLAAIGATVAGLAHCLKNTLNGLKGGQYVAERALETDDPAKLGQGLKILKDGVGHMERLTSDMLMFAGDREPDLKTSDVNQVLQEVIDLVQESASDQGVELRGDLDENLHPLPLDRHAIYRAVLNLATNAVDACVESDTGDLVILRSRLRPDSVVITVEDNGVGIPEEQLRRVTERFFTTKGSKGTGLGLPVALKIAEDHGGTLEVESALGEGTSFHLRIPRRSVDESADSVSPAEASRVRP
jgi:signal transduction histidine kinase